MCGIVGYIGHRPAAPILIKGLKQLEYRGYDSAGIALLGSSVEPDGMQVFKAKGKVSALEALLENKDLTATAGIGHTRWATHGEPCAENAHPHVSMSGKLALVHNGIIENFAVLKEQLSEKGYVFRSSTDTEVLVQLIDYYYVNNGEHLVEAVRAALNKVIGAYAIVVVEAGNPHHFVAARKASPLVVGVGRDGNEYFVASDATPIVEYTRRVIYLDDEQIADICPGQEISISTLDAKSVSPDITRVDLDISKLSKGGYEHFMLKEIYDQPQCIIDCMRGRLIEDENGMRIELSALHNFKQKLIRARHIIIVACGTSWHAGLIGKQLIEKLCRIRVEVEYASEFRYRDPVIDKDDVVIAISQSGETADTLAAIELARQHGAFVFGIVNGVGSSIARAASTGIYIHVGPEIGVASTKAFTGQVTVLSLLALALGRELGTLSDADNQKMLHELSLIPEKMKR